MNAALFLLSNWTAQSTEHSETVSNVFSVDFLGVLPLIALALATAIPAVLSLRR